MSSMEFSFGAPKLQQDPEGQMLSACLKTAVGGQDAVFPLNVVENISVPLIGKDGVTMEVASFALSFQSHIPVLAVAQRKAIRYTTFEDGDASTEKQHTENVWHTDSFYMEVGKAKPTDMSLPEYLRCMAREWATALVEKEVNEILSDGRRRSAWDIEQQVDIRTTRAGIESEFEALSISVDRNGDAALGQRRNLPVFRIGPDPVMGANHHLGLAYSAKAGVNWPERMTAFAIGDYAAADEIRTELVRRHCGEYDPEFGYDWTDARLFDAAGVIERDEQLMSHFSMNRFKFDDVLNDLGQNFAAEFSNSGGEWRPIQAALLTGDLDKSFDAIRTVAEARPRQYQSFLDKSGWTLPFDPLELFDIRLRHHRGLAIGAQRDAKPLSVGPKP